MALKRALVVDDSKFARIALKKQLEEYYLHVDLAESGEDALEFLKTHMVDVIFMDHIMPGMDGLEAMTVIKKNPLTATIPVMMYTSKEGEVYVSQARALGAVGVLPKQVQPGVLFGMLAKLGLVIDRRSNEASNDDDASPPPEERRGKAEPEAIGMALPSLVSRILKDQRSALRSELLGLYEDLPQKIAGEVHARLREDEDDLLRERATPGPGRAPLLVSGALAVALLLAGTWFVQVKTDHGAALETVAELTAELEQERALSKNLSQQLASNLDAELALSDSAVRTLLRTLVWTVNESGSVGYEEAPFDAARAGQIEELLRQLANVGYSGTLRVESHLGEFCLVSDASGVYGLAEPDTPVAACTFIGHPLDNSMSLAERQTPEFETFVVNSPLVNDSGIELDLIVNDRSASIPRIPYPVAPQSAGEWNQVAAQNNRLEFSLVDRR